MSSAPRPLLVLLLLAVVAAIWGSTWLVIKFGLRDLPPFTGAGLRFVLAGVAMAVVARWLSKAEGGAPPRLALVLAHGLCQFAGNYGLVYYAETLLPSGLVSVLWSIFPLLMGLSGHFVLKTERLRPRQWLGFILGFLGVVLLFATDIRAISARAVAAGALLLIAPICVAASTTFIKRTAASTSSLLLNRDSMLLGAAVLLGFALIMERDAELNFSAVALGSIVYLALFGTVFTFGVYMWLLRFVAASRLSLIGYVTPVIALLIGAVWGGEPIGLFTVMGTLLVLFGVGCATLRVRRVKV